jgi:phosphoserine phosphatase
VTRFLVVFDVDSTLIEQEVIELLAAEAGQLEEVARVTELAMAGELDFADSLAKRVALLKGLPVSAFENVAKQIRISPGAVELIDHVHALGGRAAAVSGGFTQILEPLGKMLRLDAWLANDLEVMADALTGGLSSKVVDRAVKAEKLVEWSKDYEVRLDCTVAIGDGANDLDMLEAAGLAVAYNAKPLVRKSADLVVEYGNLGSLMNVLT